MAKQQLEWIECDGQDGRPKLSARLQSRIDEWHADGRSIKAELGDMLVKAGLIPEDHAPLIALHETGACRFGDPKQPKHTAFADGGKRKVKPVPQAAKTNGKRAAKSVTLG